MTRFALSALCFAIVTTAGATASACTPEEAQAKAVQLQQAAQQMAATDPAKTQEVMTKMQESVTQLSAAGDIEAVCNFYDEMLAELGS